MKTLSLDMRKRILACYDGGIETYESTAKLFGVSRSMVKKLIRQRKELGDIAPLHWRAGRKPVIYMRHKTKLLEILWKKPDTTLKELRTALGISCSLTTIHNALAKWGMTHKKRRLGPASKIRKTVQRSAENSMGI